MPMSVRNDIAHALKSVWPKDMPMFEENVPLRDTRLETGYVRYQIVFGDPDQPALLGHDNRIFGTLVLTIALPHGKGMARVDSLSDLLVSQLANRRFGRLHFLGIIMGTGARTGDFWIFDSEIAFAHWPQETR